MKKITKILLTILLSVFIVSGVVFAYEAYDGIQVIEGDIFRNSVYPMEADTYDIGSTTKEWKNFYIGDAGKIYLGLGQDASINRNAANEMTLTATSGITIDGEVTQTYTTTANSYANPFTSTWTAGADMAAGGSNGIYGWTKINEDVQNAYGLRARTDLRSAAAGVGVNQLHSVDALVNLGDGGVLTVVDNVSVFGAAIHSVGITAADITGGSLNLFYGAWGDSVTENFTIETNGMLLMTHANTNMDYGVQVQNSGAMTAGLYLLNHPSNSPATMTSGILMESAAGNMTYGINMTGASITTADILLQSGDTILNAASGVITISGDLDIADDNWVGLSSSAARIQFDDDTLDKIELSDGLVQIGDGTYSWTHTPIAGGLGVEGILEVDGAAYFDSTLSVDGAADFSNTVTGITAGASSAIEWTGASEWMQIFLENQDTSPGSSGVVISLINDASIVSGDQITLELKGDIATGTDLDAGGAGHLTTLRTRVEFKGNSTYTSGNVQAINAVLGSDAGVTLDGSALHAGNFRVRLGSDPGHADILLLENDSVTDESYLDSFVNFHGGGAQYLFEFGPVGDTTSWNRSADGQFDTQAGWLKVKVGGADRYIKLSDSVTAVGDLTLGDDQKLYLDTAKGNYLTYDSGDGMLRVEDGGGYPGLVSDSGLYFYANSPTYEPYFELGDNGEVYIENTTQGTENSRKLYLRFSSGVALSEDSNKQATLRTNLLTDHRIFRFPNIAGTLVTSAGIGGNIDIGAYDLRAATITPDGLTSGRVVFAGANGVLSDDVDFTFSGAALTLGSDGTDGRLNLFSEIGGTDYTASLFAHQTMTSDANFYLPADEPGATYLLNMTSGGVMGYDTTDYHLYDATVCATGCPYTDIQAAIDAGKHKLFIKDGTYTLTANIVITADETIIIGESWDAIIAADTFQIVITAADRVRISNLKITGTNGAGTLVDSGETHLQVIDNNLFDSTYGIRFGNDETNAVIRDNHFTGANSIRAIWTAGSYTLITGNQFYDFGTGVAATIDVITTNVNYITISNNQFSVIGSAAALNLSCIVVTDGNQIIGNHFKHTYSKVDSGDLKVIEARDSNVIANNAIHSTATTGNNSYGIYANGRFNVIEGNRIQSMDATTGISMGIYADQRNVVDGNYLTGIAAGTGDCSGIYVERDRNIISNNHIASFETGQGGDRRSIRLAATNTVANVIIGNTFDDSIHQPDAFIEDSFLGNTIEGHSELSVVEEGKIYRMTNTDGDALAAGDLVVLKAVAAGNEVTHTTTAGDDMVFGMATESIANAASGMIQILGKTKLLKVNGTDDIAIGDFICAYTSEGIGKKCSSENMAIAVALEVYTTNDSSGVIDAILIIPKRIEGADIALSNLGSVAINTSLISDTAGTDDLGSEALFWNDLYIKDTIQLEGATDNDFQLTITLTDPTTPDKTATFQDFTGYVVMDTEAVNDLEGNALSITTGTLNVDDVFLLHAGDTATGDMDFTGAIFMGATPLVLEGATDNAYQLNIAVADIASSSKTATFQDFTGYVVMNVNAVTDLEGTGLSVTTGTLNWASTGLTWAGNVITHEKGGIEADISAIVKGGLLVGTGTNTIGIETIGTNDYVLVADSTSGGGVKWAAEADPTVDSAAEILAIIDDTALDFGTGVLTATGFVGPLTGEAATVATITGLAPNTATTQATQGSITSIANLATVGTIGTGTWEATDVGVAHGGTGKSSWTQYLIPYSDTTTSFSQIAIGSDGDVLTSGGAGVAPSFEAPAGGGGYLDSTSTSVNVNNTDVETTLVTFAVPANTIGATGAIKVTMWGSIKMIDNAEFRMFFKYDDTTLCNVTPGNFTGDTHDGHWRAQFILMGDGTTSDQFGTGVITTGETSWQDRTDQVGMVTQAAGAATEDATTQLTLAITGDWISGANANNLFTMRYYLMEKIVE